MKNTNRITNLIKSLVLPTKVFLLGDGIAFYDAKDNRVHIIDAMDFLRGNYESFCTIKKTSYLNNFNRIIVANIEDFIEANPESEIDEYIISKVSDKEDAALGKYIAAYMHLYRLYKSFSTLVAENYIDFIDTFIEKCMSEETDHLSTITYSKKELHKVLRLRKAVFNMFEPYLTNYNTYKNIEYLHNSKQFSDKEFRRIKRKIRDALKQAKIDNEAAEAGAA